VATQDAVAGSVTLGQAAVMAVLQGITELFPVSSLAHGVLVPHLLGWGIDQQAPSFLPFLVALHLGTAVALLVYFWRDWWALLSSLLPAGAGPQKETGAEARADERHILWLLVLGTVPAGLLGLTLEKRLAPLFGAYRVVAVSLILNGLMLLLGEWLRRRQRPEPHTLTTLRPVQAALVGLAQAIALVPGFSRSGAAMVGGLLVGLSHEAAARFAFLLATPIILGAAVLELPKLLGPAGRPALGPALVGGVLAGLVAYASTALLMRYFRRREANDLVPFAVYCILAGLVAFVLS
jgi:undecaprenyl-diphosphatase